MSTHPDEAMAALASKMHTVPPARPEKLYRCRVCLDRGWIEAEPVMGPGTVERCPRGCGKPAARSEGAVTIR